MYVDIFPLDLTISRGGIFHKMIKLYDEGVYLINGEKIVPESQAANQYNKAEAKKGTIAYGIIKYHNTSSDMEYLRIKFDSMASHDIKFVGSIQTARASKIKKIPFSYTIPTAATFSPHYNH